MKWATAMAVLAASAACSKSGDQRKRERGPVAVAVAPVRTGAIELRRTFAGSVRSQRSFVVAAHVPGRVQKLHVDLADEVERGQVVAELDAREDAQGVSQAYAELGVARARLAQARAELDLAQRELQRIEGLHGKGAVSASELDRARAQKLASASAVRVARATLRRMGAGLQSARIRSGYKRVVAAWTDDDRKRVVAQRHVSVGDRVTAGQPIFTVVDLDPVQVVVNVGEKDYASLAVKQPATITSDAIPGRQIPGAVTRIAPVFREASRQARVEIELPNKDHALKPGMFVRASIVLRREANATIVPFGALTTRGGRPGVFVVDGQVVRWREVEVGIRQGDQVQVTAEGVSGRVVTLGQQLLGDGASITIPAREPAPGPKRSADRRGAR